MTNSKSPKAAEATTAPKSEKGGAAAEPKTPAPKKASKAKAPTLADACRVYLEHLEEAGKSPGTQASYRAELLLAAKHLGADTPLSKITTAKVQAYFESEPVNCLRSGKPKAPASIAKSQRVLRLALVHAEQQKLIAAAPIPEKAAKA